MAKKWSTVITSKHKVIDLKLKEVYKYKDLVSLFVKRNLKVRYKQTILGPLWFIIQPIFTTLMHTLVFGSIAGLPTDGVPQFLFYMAGNVPWLFFSSCLTNTSSTFTSNSGVFGKVYFPRMVTPLATIFTNMIDFLVQFIMLMGFAVAFLLMGENVYPTWELLLVPVLVLQMGLLGMGIGIIISSLTTKYRDLQVLVSFGVSLLMYASPVVYSSSMLVEGSTLYNLIMLNPISPVIDLFRYATIGGGSYLGSYNLMFYGISWGVTLLLLFVGLIIFNKVEKTFMDTV